MYSLPSVVDAYRRIPAYWLKDDHDILQDDCWTSTPSTMMRPLTFTEGQRPFPTMVPQARRTYRSARWGKALEVWFLENRDLRSPNDAPDGPQKTIWGAAQRDWLKRTLVASTATFKVIVTPNPIIGLDRDTKRDNHSNASFAHEGSAFRRWLKDSGQNVVILCGDRHWQYHSVDPDTGIEELGSGPLSHKLAGGSSGEKPAVHRFHRQRGGFLSGGIVGAEDAASWRCACMIPGTVVHEHRRGRRVV